MTDTRLPPVITINDERRDVLSVPSEICSIPMSEHEVDAITMMRDVLDDLGPDAMGIAAVQVGVPRRVFMLRMPDGELRSFVNPIIESRSRDTTNKLEGCLSVPGSSFRVVRPQNVTLSYSLTNGEQRTEDFGGQYARAVCHEMDHLNGKLIIEHLNAHADAAARKIKSRQETRRKVVNRNRAKAQNARRSRRRNRRG